MRVVRGEDGALLSTSGGAFVIDLREMLVRVTDRLGLPGTVVDRIPEDAGQLVVFESGQLDKVQQAVDMVEKYGPERLLIAGACDWGPSEPIAVPKLIAEMRRRRHSEALIHRVVFENPVRFLGQSPKFRLPDEVASAAALHVG